MANITWRGTALLRAIFISLAPLALVTTALAHLPDPANPGGMSRVVEKKTYPGAQCQPGPFASPGDLEYSFEGHVTNTASGSVFIVCPIVYDVFDEDRAPEFRGIGHGGVSAQVRVNKVDAVGLYCELQSRDAHGTTMQSQSQWNFGPAGHHILTLPNVPWSPVGPEGYYVLTCILAPGHVIHSYHVVEH